MQQTKTVKLKTNSVGSVSLAPPTMHPGYHKDPSAFVVTIERVPAHLPTAAVLTAYRNAVMDVSFDDPSRIVWDEMLTWDDTYGHSTCGFFVASLSHHGHPLQLDDPQYDKNSLIWRDFGELSPRRYLERISRLLRARHDT